MYKCNQCYNISDCDIYLALQKLTNKNKDINLRLAVEECNNYKSGIQKLIEDIENGKITIEEAKGIKEIGFINFDELNRRMKKFIYGIEE